MKLVWHAAEHMPPPFGAIIRLLILAGQRKSEIGGLK